MVHWAYIEDSVYVKGMGLIVTFSKPHGFSATSGNVVTLFSPDGRTVITTVVRGVEKFARAFELPHDPIGVMLGGFVAEVRMIGWLMAVHENTG